jgi:hypothetical protein
MQSVNKKILIVYYSQSGQLTEIVNRFIAGFAANSAEFDTLNIQMQKAFPFPWNSATFFDAMPESVLVKPAPIVAPQFKYKQYDLIVIAYQPWFLSPSIPANSIFADPTFSALLKNTPVVTLIGARNMWVEGQKKMKQLIANAGAKLVGNIVLIDRHPNLISAVTIQYWMFTGKKEGFWGVFPKPGVSDSDIQNTTEFGSIVETHLNNNTLDNLQTALLQKKAVEVNHLLMFVESRGAMIFKLWAALILKKSNRSLWINIFKYYLIFALFLLSPIIIVLYSLILRPLMYKKINLLIQEARSV